MDKLMRIVAFVGGLFFALSMGVVLYLGTHKTVVVAESATSTVENSYTSQTRALEQELHIAAENTSDSYLYLPLQDNVKAENINMQSAFLFQGVGIEVEGAEGYFYETNELSGRVNVVKSATYQQIGSKTHVLLEFNDVFECSSRVDGNRLVISLHKPKDIYQKIVVIDDRMQVAGGTEAHRITTSVEEKIRTILTTDGYRVYYTGASENVTDMDVINLVNRAGADIYIGLQLSRDNDTQVLGTKVYYNGDYYIPWLTNAELADSLEKAVVTAVQGKGLGIEKCGQYDLLRFMEIPAARISLGYISSDKEGALLRQNNYQQVLAESICQVLQEDVQ